MSWVFVVVGVVADPLLIYQGYRCLLNIFPGELITRSSSLIGLRLHYGILLRQYRAFQASSLQLIPSFFILNTLNTL